VTAYDLAETHLSNRSELDEAPADMAVPEEKQGGRFAWSLKRNREGELREAWRYIGREICTKSEKKLLGSEYIYNDELIFLLLDWQQTKERRGIGSSSSTQEEYHRTP
jgi:hypothetical protein